MLVRPNADIQSFGFWVERYAKRNNAVLDATCIIWLNDPLNNMQSVILTCYGGKKCCFFIIIFFSWSKVEFKMVFIG